MPATSSELYLNINAIGVNHIEVDDNAWETMQGFSTNSIDEFMSLFNDWVFEMKACQTQVNLCDGRDDYNIYTEFYYKEYIDFRVKSKIFFNSLLPSNVKQTGIVTEQFSVPNPTNPGVPISLFNKSVDVDYGLGVFTEELWNEHEKAIHEFACSVQRVMKYMSGETYEDVVATEFETAPPA